MVDIGTIGRVRVLMIQEIESVEPTQKNPATCKRKLQSLPVSLHCGTSKASRQSKEASGNVTSTSSANKTTHQRAGNIQKKNDETRYRSHHMPMLQAEDIAADRTPTRIKHENKKVSQIVEIVDLKCGLLDRAWSDPITNQFRRLSFSRLSD